MNLSENAKFILAKSAQTAATSAVTTDVIDMTGFREIVFAGAIDTKNAANYIHLQEGALADGSDMADLAGTKTGANKTYFKAGLVRPRKRYVRLKVTRGSSTATGAVWAILFKARLAPISSAAADLEEKTFLSPSAGTP